VFTPPLPINISEQKGRITAVIATIYQGLLTKVREEMECLFDVQRSALAEFILDTCTTYKKTSCIQYRSAYVPSIINTNSNLYQFWKGICFVFQVC